MPEKTVEIGMQFEELIGLPNFSNVRIATQVVRRTVTDNEEAVKAGFAECQAQCGQALAEARELVLLSVKAAAKKGSYGDVRQSV
jgi:hypothetical protein